MPKYSSVECTIRPWALYAKLFLCRMHYSRMGAERKKNAIEKYASLQYWKFVYQKECKNLGYCGPGLKRNEFQDPGAFPTLYTRQKNSSYNGKLNPGFLKSKSLASSINRVREEDFRFSIINRPRDHLTLYKFEFWHWIRSFFCFSFCC